MESPSIAFRYTFSEPSMAGRALVSGTGTMPRAECTVTGPGLQ